MGEVYTEIGIKEFIETVDYVITNGMRLYVEGPPGIGKTQIIQEAAARHNKKLVAIYPAVLDVGDMVTKIPIKVNENHWSLAEIVAQEFPREPGSVVMFDEFRHAESATRRMCYRYFQEGKIGSSYVSPPNTALIVISNPTEDVQTEELEGPLLDRFDFRIKLKTSVADFKQYLLDRNKPMAHYIIGFLEWKPDCLAVKEETDGTMRYIVTPRRWDILTKLPHTTRDEWLKMVALVLPPGIAAEFEEFVKKVDIYSKDIRDYISGKTAFPDDKADQVAVMTAIVSHLQADAKYEELADEVLDMKMKNTDDEIMALTVFQSIRTLKLRKNLTSIKQLLTRKKNAEKLINVLKTYRYIVEDTAI